MMSDIPDLVLEQQGADSRDSSKDEGLALCELLCVEPIVRSGSYPFVVVVDHDVLKVVLTGGTLLVSQTLTSAGGLGRYRREDGRMGDGNLGLGGLLGLGSSSFNSSSFSDRFGWRLVDLSS